MNNLFFYKNFNMGSELDIAGTFIYDGMRTLEEIVSFETESEIFSFLYHVSVGIERIQKVIIVLLEEITAHNVSEFEKSLITHSHQELHFRIKNKREIEFSSKENQFLQILNEFYKKCRYDRFNIISINGTETKLIVDYIIKWVGDYERNIFSNAIINNDKIKDLFGRVIGSISKKYYSLVYEVASKQNMYTYELRSGSKAEKIFLNEFRKNSLYQLTFNEKIALKELLIYLINTKDKNPFFRFMREIEPLDIDCALVNEYIEDLSKGIISQDLIDTIDFLYQENDYSKERIEKVSLIGDSQVLFEYGIIIKCREILQKIIKGKYNYSELAATLIDEMEYIDDDEINSKMEYIIQECRSFLNNKKDNEKAIKDLKLLAKDAYKNIKNFL